jgi:hypothetical protein
MHLDLHLLLVALQRDLHPPLLLVNQWVLARDLNLDLELRLPLSLMAWWICNGIRGIKEKRSIRSFPSTTYMISRTYTSVG